MVDVVLAYRPKPKTKAAKKRKRQKGSTREGKQICIIANAVAAWMDTQP